MNENKETAADKSPQIITISAGKGGVGKTLISANLARVLSWSGKRVLLVDMDVYNRGLTTLVAEPPITDKITISGIMELALEPRVAKLKKMVAEKELAIANDGEGNQIPLYLVPSTVTSSIVDWSHNAYDIEQLKEFMAKFIQEIATKYDIDCIVIDCRPGPGALFLAAAGISTEVILVTEADVITLNGNINLYSYLADVYQENSDVLRNVRFVINRVPKGQKIDLIEERYMKRLYDLFKTRPILASIPFDNEVFRTFGQIRFVVDQLPNSIFSRNIAGIAHELFSAGQQELLSDRCLEMASSLDESWFVSSKRAIADAFGSLIKTRL